MSRVPNRVRPASSIRTVIKVPSDQAEPCPQNSSGSRPVELHAAFAEIRPLKATAWVRLVKPTVCSAARARAVRSVSARRTGGGRCSAVPRNAFGVPRRGETGSEPRPARRFRRSRVGGRGDRRRVRGNVPGIPLRFRAPPGVRGRQLPRRSPYRCRDARRRAPGARRYGGHPAVATPRAGTGGSAMSP